jgi:hypothetical protein
MFRVDRLWVSAQWEQLLREADLLDVEALSKRTFDWFEERNVRRGGWSGVARIVLNPDAAPADQRAVFLKTQWNHFCGGPQAFIRKTLTFDREYDALREIGEATGAVPEVVFFASWRSGEGRGAILVTEALDDWFPVSEWARGTGELDRPSDSVWLRALEAIASASRDINDAGWIHMSYSARHLFVRPEADGSFVARAVDLERSRKSPFPGQRTKKDCSHAFRHAPRMTEAHKLHYLHAYFRADEFTPKQLRLIRKMRGGPAV